MKKNSKIKIFYNFLIFIFLFSCFFILSFQNNIQYHDLLIFFNDPIHSMPNLALNYTAKSLTEYFNIKNVKVYTEYPLSLDAAFKLAKERDLKFLLEIKGNLINYTRTSSGYSVKIETIVSGYEIDNPDAKFNSIDTGISENALSSDIAFAYALYDGAIKAIYKIEKDLFTLIQK